MGVLQGLPAVLAAAAGRRPHLDPAAGAALAALARDAPALAGPEQRLTMLAGRFALTELDEALLAVGLLAELHPSAHLLLGLLGGDDRAGRPSVALTLELAGASLVSGAARGRLADLAPLRRHGLLTLPGDDVLLARRVRVADRVVAHVTGDDTPPAALAATLSAALPVPVEGTAAVSRALADGAGLVWVSAQPGAAGTALAVAACASLDVMCLVVDLARALPGGTGGPDGPAEAPGAAAAQPGSAAPDPPVGARVRAVVRDAVLEAALTGRVLVLAGAEAAAGSMDLLTGSPVPVLAVGSRRWDARWAPDLPLEVVAPRLTPAQRRHEWRAALGVAQPTREVMALRLTPEQIHTVGRAVRGPGTATGAASPADVTAAARRLGRARPAAGATTATLEDLVLPDHARAEVERLIGWGRHRDDVLALGDLQGKGGKAGGIAALFSGSPGTGKTLAAHVVADALGMELFQVDLSAIVDKYIGETEKNLERVFAEAEALSCVLFFDEADSLFGSRSAVNDSRDRYANQEVAYLLQRMESFDGITVLATNLRGNLDQAFARRLHFMVHFPDPDEPTRRRLWEHHLAPLDLDPADPVDVADLAAHLELAGGDIRNVVLSATFDAVGAGRAVGMSDLRRAAAREFTKLGRRPPAVLAAVTSPTMPTVPTAPTGAPG